MPECECPVEETDFYVNLPEVIGEMLRRDWSLPHMPSIAYEPEAYKQGSNGIERVSAFIYVYLISEVYHTSTCDYSTLESTARIGIKVSSRFQGETYKVCREVERIILANRRLGMDRLAGYTYIELDARRPTNELTGWQSTIITILMHGYCRPIKSAGFGDRINKLIEG